MSFLDTIQRILLFRPPTEPDYVFEAGIEDRLHEAAQSLTDKETTRENVAPEDSSPKKADKPRQRSVRKLGGVNKDQENKSHGQNSEGPPDEGQDKQRNTDADARVALSKAQREQQEKDRKALAEILSELSESRKIEDFLQAKVKLFSDLDHNQQVLEKIFRKPANIDVVFRPLLINHRPPVKALIIFFDGIVQGNTIINAVLKSLMLQASLRKDDPAVDAEPRGLDPIKASSEYFDRVMQALVAGHQVSPVKSFDEAVNEALNGNTVLFIDGVEKALAIETKGFASRGVGEPVTESVIRGPHEALVEQIRTNTGLIRKILRRPSLVTEFVKVGQASIAQYAIMYMDDIANPALVKEVKRRLESLKVDFPNESGILEQLIEDSPYALAPQVMATERPDRVAASIMEGKVAILADNSPFALIVPTTFFSLMQSGEDAYVRWPFGSFARVVRWFGLALALFLPGFYVAVATFHQEFIPTGLLLAITGARERVPFPTILEILLMELSFELIREAGVRIPGTVGTTLGIVGALILGQAAVAANIVSPILIVIIAVTALGAFAIPNYSFSLNIRLLRFGYTISAAIMGLFGMLFMLFVHIGLLTNIRSFGVPFCSPLAPATKASPDWLLRGHAWSQETRPDFMDPVQVKRQPEVSRGWVNKGGERGNA